MYRCNDNVSAQSAKADKPHDHESHPSLVHKIADKLGIHSSHKADDHTHTTHDGTVSSSHSNQHEHPSYETIPLENNQRDGHKEKEPGVVQKIADKLGLHHSDHHEKKEKHVFGEIRRPPPSAAHDHVVADMDGYPMYPPDRLDNDPNHHFPHHDEEKESPGFADKIKSKLGIHSDDKKDGDHHKKADEAELFGAPSSNPHGHDGLGEVNTTSADFGAAQAHKDDSPGFADKIKSKLGIHSSDTHDNHH